MLLVALSVFGLALLDSLNPSLIATQLFLLTTPQPLWRSLSFILSVILTSFVGGWLVLTGLSDHLYSLLHYQPSPLEYGIQVLLGVLLIAFAVRLYRNPPQGDSPQPTPSYLHPLAIFGFGIFSTISELPTALPYFAAITQIAEAQIHLITTGILLIIYNLLYVLPLGILLGLYFYSPALRSHLEAIGVVIRRWNHQITIGFLGLIAAILLVDGLGALTLGRALL